MNFLPTIPRILGILAIVFVSLFDTYDPFLYTHNYPCNCLEKRIYWWNSIYPNWYLLSPFIFIHDYRMNNLFLISF